jgi:hypothetical protein
MFISTLTSRVWYSRGANSRVQSLECDTFEFQFPSRRQITVTESRRCFLTLIVHNSCFAFRKCLVNHLVRRPASMAGISWLFSVHPRKCGIFSWPRSSLWVSSITLRHTTLDSTLLDEWSARRRDLYLTTHNNHNGQTSITPVRLETDIPASERPQIHALDRAATGIGNVEAVPKIGLFPLSATFIPIYYLLIILSFDAVWSETLIAKD